MFIKKAKKVLLGATLLLTSSFFLLTSCGEKSTPETLFKETVKSEVTSFTNPIVNGVYEALDNVSSNEIAAEGSLTLQIGNGLRPLLKIVADEIGMSVSWIKTLSFNIHETIKDTSIGAAIITSLNDQKLFTTNFLVDTKESQVYLQIPEIIKKYFYLQNEELSDAFSEYNEALNEIYKYLKMLPEKEVVTALVNEMIDSILQSITLVDEENKTVTVKNKDGEVSQNYKALTTKIDSDTATKIYDNFYNCLKESRNLQKIAKSAENILNTQNGYTYIEAKDIIEEFIYEATDAVEEFLEIYPEITVYTNDKKEFGGIEITAEGETVSYLTPSTKDKFAVEFSVSSDVFLTGYGSKKGNEYSGNFKFLSNYEELLVLETKNLSMNNLGFTGTITLSPSDILISELQSSLKYSNLSSLSSFLDSIKLSITGESVTKNEQKFSFTVSDSDDLDYFSVSVNAKNTKPFSMTKPSDKEILDIENMDEYDLEDLIYEIDLKPIAESLDKAGAPSKITSLVNSLDPDSLLELLEDL